MRTTKLLALPAVAAVALIAGEAGAAQTPTATYRGSVGLLGADGAYARGFGTATLTITRRRGRLVVKVRHFPRRTTFRFALVRGTCSGGLARSRRVPGFRVTKPLRTTSRRTGTGVATARRVRLSTRRRYAVFISRTRSRGGRVVACAQMSRRR